MKLLMSSDCVGGVWTYALDLAKALAPHGVEVHLATMGAPLAPDQRADAGAIDNVTVHESSYRLEWMADAWDDVRRAGRWLLELEHDVRADLVHLNTFSHGTLSFRAPVVVAAHSCVCSWYEAVRKQPAPREWERYRREVAAGLRGADVVVAPTRWMLDAAVRAYGPLPRTRVIYNGRDTTPYRRGQKHNVILTAGRLWDEAKNVSVLKLVSGDLPWPVCVAGDGMDAADADAHLRVLGRLNAATLAQWFARAAIYCLPARYEPFGLSALEAGLSGCALVLGDIPSLREVWGDAAAFVDPDDPAALRERLLELIESPARRLRLSARSWQRAMEYTLPRMGEGYIRTYRQILRDRDGVEAHDATDSAFAAPLRGTLPG